VINIEKDSSYFIASSLWIYEQCMLRTFKFIWNVVEVMIMLKKNLLLKKGDFVEVKTVNGTIKKGTIVSFEERTVVISVGVDCYLVKKSELEKQNFRIPPFKKKV